MTRRIFIIALMISLTVLLVPMIASAQSTVDFAISFGDSTPTGYFEWTDYILSSASIPGTPEGDCTGAYGHLSGGNLNGDSVQCGGTDLYQDRAYIDVTLPLGCDVTEWSAPYSLETDVVPGVTNVYNWVGSTVDNSTNTPLSATSGFVGWSPGTWNEVSGATHMLWAVATAQYTTPPGNAAYDYIHFTCSGVDPEDYPGSAPAEPFQPIRINQQVSVDDPVDLDQPFPPPYTINAQTYDFDNCWYDASCSDDHPDEVPVFATHSGTIIEVRQSGDTYWVTLDEQEDDGLTLRMFYKNLASVFVQPGDRVSGGCIIGTAGPSFNPSDDDPTHRSISFLPRDLDLDEDVTDWQDWRDPTEALGCDSNVTTTSCINNDPRFHNPDFFWGTGRSATIPQSYPANVTFTSDAATLQPGGFIHQEIVVDGTPDEVKVTLVASLPAGQQTGKLRVSFGDDSEDIYVSYDGPARATQRVIPVTGLVATEPTFEPDLYSLKIENISALGVDVRLFFVCMSASAAEVVGPDACYFNDDGGFANQFDDDGSNDWTLADGATITPSDFSFLGFNHDYFLNLPIGGSANYPLDLPAYTETPTDYVLELHANVGSVNIVATNVLTIGGTEDTDTDIDITTSLFIQTITHNFTLEADTPIEGGTLSLTNTTISESNDSILIKYACLHPVDGIWPGHEDVDWQPVPTGVRGGLPCASPCGDDGIPGDNASYIPPICQQPLSAPHMPALDELDITDSSALATWITGWGTWASNWWHLLADIPAWLFTCEFKPLFNRGIAQLMTFADWITMIGKWYKTTIGLWSKWLLSVVNYALSSIGNTVTTAINQLWEAIIGLDLIKQFFDKLSIAQLVFDLMSSLAGTILAAILNGVKALATLAQFISILWGYIFTGINGTTVADTGIPTCDSIIGTDFFYSFCRFNSLVDYGFTLWPGLWSPIIVLIGIIVISTFDLARKWIGAQFSEVS